MLLAAIERFAPVEVVKLLKHLVVLIVRYQLIGRGRTGRLEIAAANLAQGIFSSRLKSAQAVWSELKSIVPSDDDFKVDFARYTESKAQRARYLLRRLEEERFLLDNPGKGLQLSPVSDPNKVNLEHILPKKPDTSWAPLISADHTWSDLVDRVGNLCLLDKPTNKKQGSGPFSSKAKAYAASLFILTSEVSAKHSVWDRKTVDARQTEMADLAVRTWPL
jgi:hypothetical protein